MFVVYVTELDRTLAPTPLDNDLLELGDRLRMDMLVDVAKLVTHLGAFPTAAGLVAATAAVLAARRRYAEIFVLVAGLVLVYIAVNVTKEAIDRPRPTGPFVGASGDAYPSGHAAYATAWVAAAFILTRQLRLVPRARSCSSRSGSRRPWRLAHLPARALVVGRRGRLGPRGRDLRAAGRNRPRRRAHSPQWAGGGLRRDLMGNIELSSTEIVIALAGALTLACWVALILAPAIRCYGRVWRSWPRDPHAVRARHARGDRRGDRLR